MVADGELPCFGQGQTHKVRLVDGLFKWSVFLCVKKRKGGVGNERICPSGQMR